MTRTGRTALPQAARGGLGGVGAALARRRPCAHIVLDLDIGSLLHEALDRSGLIQPRRKVQRSYPLRVGGGRRMGGGRRKERRVHGRLHAGVCARADGRAGPWLWQLAGVVVRAMRLQWEQGKGQLHTHAPRRKQGWQWRWKWARDGTGGVGCGQR